jgi:Holliday junction resolvasome RuvABC endonuclease subunit
VKITAFDLGTTWALASNTAGFYATYHAMLTGKRPEKLGQFMRQMQGLADDTDVIVYERPFARGQAATRLLWAMAGIIEGEAHNQGCAVLDWTPTEIKLWATGSGKADKDAMMVAARRLGYLGDNEHEADAFCLLKMAEAQLTKDPA